MNDQIVDLVTNRRAIHTAEVKRGKRSTLAPHRANWLSFIHDNFALYFKTQNDNDVLSTVLC